MLSISVSVVIILCHVLLIIFNLPGAWPFEPYVMFSRPMHPNSVSVYRLAYQDYRGRIRWWAPHDRKLVEITGHQIATYRRQSDFTKEAWPPCITTIISQLFFDDPRARGASTFLIVLRRSTVGADGRIEIHDYIVCSYPLADIVEVPQC
jgi:hypothetical protein